MTPKTIKCAETGTLIGAGTGIDIYKWTITTFHLPDIGVERLLKDYGDKTDERSKRIVANLSALKEG